MFCLEEANLIVTSDATDFSKSTETGFVGLIDLPKKPYTSWKGAIALPQMEKKPICKVIPSPVAFTAASAELISYNNPESACLSIASELFENLTLHRRVREQGGAYGSGASYNPTSGLFYFYSHRDPNIASTQAAFDEVIQEVVAGRF